MADRVLLTGISGFLGGHTALALLKAGYIVRGSVRDLNRSDTVKAALAAAGGDLSRLELVALDLMSDAGWDAAMADVRYLQHVASPFVTKIPADKMELVTPAVEGTRRALEAALRAKIERIVLTSSMAAITYGHPKEDTNNRIFASADWTRLEGGRGVNAYIESKTRAERKAWDIMDAAGRHNDLAVINPGGILGPLLDDDPGTSVALIARYLNGSLPMVPHINFTPIDVRDVAAAHVAAMTAPGAGGQRFPMGDRPFSLLEGAQILRSAFPAYAAKLPRGTVPDWVVRLVAMVDADMRGNTGELSIIRRIDSHAAVALLGRPFIAPDVSVRETAQSLIDRKLV